jgi:hypothetical protein
MFSQVEQIIVLFAILIVVVGLPLYWLRLKLERGLIHIIRSARSRRERQKSPAKAVESDTSPHCPVCNALMVKRVARRGSRSGSAFLVAVIIPNVEARARFSAFKLALLSEDLRAIMPREGI